MPEIAEAQALLVALAESDEVRAAIAQRKRRLHLQTTLAHAEMWSKGFAADETMTAFARAAELATNDSSFSERFAAAHGQWTMAIARGELSTAPPARFGDAPRGGGYGPQDGSQRCAPRSRFDLLLQRSIPRSAKPMRAGSR
jgi:hypothetical protein